MEKFLDFWSHYNATIIEVLVGLILLSTIYLVYRTFFGAKGANNLEASTVGGGASVNTAHIEKTLQKILEQQSTLKVASVAAESSASPSEVVQELNLLRKALEEKEKQIVILQDKASQALKASDGGPSAEAIAAAASAAAGMAEKERSDYETKIKELEARLAEYEIISEDIADLSFYKEENARLTQELEALRGSASAEPSASPSPAEVIEEPAVTVADPVPEITPASVEGGDAIDESLMAEFAKAVEGQKSAAAAEVPPVDENNKLLEEFENFNKKS